MPDRDPAPLAEPRLEQLIVATHAHPLPDVDADAGTYSYSDGCSVIKHANGQSDYFPASHPQSDPALD